MNPESAFNELGVDAVTGSLLMEVLGVTTAELQIPRRFEQLKAVINYLKDFPEDTQRYLINKATRGKMVDKLEHMAEYTNLLKQRTFNQDILKKIDDERSATAGNSEPTIEREIAQRALDVRATIGKLSDEISLYEK